MRASKLTPLALIVLELLAEQDLHPYEMRQFLLGRRRDLRVRITPGSLYRTVERLAEDGFAEVVETSRAGKRPERTVYAITDAGRDAFADRLREMIAIPATEYPQYPTALVCLHALTKQDALEQLGRRQMQLEAAVAAYDVIADRLATTVPTPVQWIDVDYEQTIRRAELAWTVKLIDDLTAGRLAWPEEDPR